METVPDITNPVDDKFFEDIREYIIGAEGAEMPVPPHPGMEKFTSLAEELRTVYDTHDTDEEALLVLLDSGEEDKAVPHGWVPLYDALVAEIDRFYGAGSADSLRGYLGVIDLGPEHFATI